MLNVGDVAPEFTLAAHDGKEVTLSALRGTPVVLWFYPRADTPGCTIEGQGFRAKAAELAAKSAVVLGVSFDPVDANCAFAEKYGFGFRLLSDTSRAAGLAYGACDAVDAPSARRISYLIGPDGRIRHVFTKVDVKTHADEVVALL